MYLHPDHNDEDDPVSHLTLLEKDSPVGTKKISRTSARLWIIHSILLVLYTTAYMILWIHQRQHSGFKPYAPARDTLEHVLFTTDVDHPSKFRGDPSPDSDQAWEDLFQGYNTRLSPTMLQKIGQDSIPLADGSGDYWGMMNVFHNLHCLKEIRQALAPGYYGTYHTEGSSTETVYDSHIEHCIESLRLYLMCNADVTMLTWYWQDLTPQDHHPYPRSNYTFNHECVDWEKLHSWAVDNSFKISPETIQHPKYGYPYFSEAHAGHHG